MEGEKEDVQEKSAGSSKGENSEEITELTNDDSFVQQQAWEIIGVAGEYHQCVEATEREQRKIINKLHGVHIQLEEVEQWKNRNLQRVTNFMEECQGEEYRTMKRLVAAIIEEKQKEDPQQSKEDENKDEQEEKTSTEQESNRNQNEAVIDTKNDAHANNRADNPQIEESQPKNTQTMEEENGQGRGVQ